MMAAILEFVSWSMLLAGSLLVVVGGIGVLRLPDFYTRLHGAGLTDTGGAALIMLGLMLQAGPSLVTVKLVIILVFLFITSPTSTHALAKAALGSGVKPRLHDESEDEPSKT